MKSKEEWDKPFEDPTESSKENLTEIEQLAEAIRIKHIPNGCINLALHIRGKKAYKIEKQTIRLAMIEFGKAYADQFKGENEAIAFGNFIGDRPIPEYSKSKNLWRWWSNEKRDYEFATTAELYQIFKSK